jgi:hypothetical protein
MCGNIFRTWSLSLKEIMMIIRSLGFGAFLAASFFLSGCQTIFNISPDRAAVQEIVTNGPSPMEVNRDTIRVLQLQESEQDFMVLATYLATHESGQLNECLSLYKATKANHGWNAFGYGSNCWPAARVDQESISISMGQNVSTDGSMSDVSGLVYDPEIKSIEINWDDGTSQIAEVVKGSYLAVQSVQNSVQFVQAFNETGDLVYSYQQPTPAPGKENP